MTEAIEVDDLNDFHGAYLITVSTTSNPHKPWEIYRIEPTDNSGLVDYSTLGYDGEAVYLSQNFFALPGFDFEGATLTVFDKQDLKSGETNLELPSVKTNTLLGGRVEMYGY